MNKKERKIEYFENMAAGSEVNVMNINTLTQHACTKKATNLVFRISIHTKIAVI